MLKRLTIQNFALISSLDVSFCDGLNVLTGETGAGKSIVLDALSADYEIGRASCRERV